MTPDTIRREMSQDVGRLVERWHRAGRQRVDMPSALLQYAMSIILDQECSPDRALERLDKLIDQAQNAKEQVANDWPTIMERKGPIITRMQNDDQHPTLFPMR